MSKYKLDCGCTIDLINPTIKLADGLESLNIPYEELTLDCQKTWQIFTEGYTKGVFQLETRFGQTWCKKLRPTNIEEAAALISLLRPGCINSIVDGKSMTNRYIDRKHGDEVVEFLHPELEEILRDTYGVLVYQEQSMKIAQKLAGFNLEAADALRKAIGKKKPEIMAKVKIDFIKGCKETGLVNEKEAEEIFSWIEKSQRYSFNKCISGKTILKRNSGKFKTSLSVAEMYKIRNDINYAKKTKHLSLYKKWKLRGDYGFGYSMYKDGRIRPNIIKDIIFQGIRKVYKITTECNKSIVVTNNHKFPTPNGKKKLSELNINDELYICGKYEKSNFAQINKFSSLEIKDIRSKKSHHDGKTVGFMVGKNNPGFTNGEYTKFIKNSNKLPNFCQLCNTSNSRLEIHHIDGNREHNELSNLIRLCSSCHKKEEYKNGRTKKGEKGYPSYLSKIKSIQYIGEEEVYDITMNAPNHNFVTNNDIVTCNSHAVGYAYIGYWTAWDKAHYPIHFFTSWLYGAKEKQKPQDEIRELVNDAHINKIEIVPPSLSYLDEKNRGEFCLKDSKPVFGLVNVKKIGSAQINKLLENIKEYEDISGKKLEKWTWYQFLVLFSDKVTSSALSAMIEVGALSFFGLPRRKMLYETQIWRRLTNKEKSWVQTHNKEFKNLESALIGLSGSERKDGGVATKKRREVVISLIKSIHDEMFELKDDPSWIVKTETELLGLPLSYSNLDNVNTDARNTTCQEFLDGKTGDMTLAVEIVAAREYIIKNGKNKGNRMGFLSIKDETAPLDNIVMFTNVWEKNKEICYESNTVLINGYKSDRNSLIVKALKQL